MNLVPVHCCIRHSALFCVVLTFYFSARDLNPVSPEGFSLSACSLIILGMFFMSLSCLPGLKFPYGVADLSSQSSCDEEGSLWYDDKLRCGWMLATDSCQKGKQSFLSFLQQDGWEWIGTDERSQTWANEQPYFSLIHSCCTQDHNTYKRVRRGSPSPRNSKNAFNFWKLINAKTKNNEVFDVCDFIYVFKYPCVRWNRMRNKQICRRFFREAPLVFLCWRKFKPRVWSHLKMLLSSARPEDRNQRL